MSRFGYQRLRIGVVLGAALGVAVLGAAGALAGPNDTVQSCVRDGQGQGNVLMANSLLTAHAVGGGPRPRPRDPDPPHGPPAQVPGPAGPTGYSPSTPPDAW